ncbi:MAG: imidazoleglycerol-phosphate dehydratase HisB [Defluviitaleaceae bacterium]|nr:imidazoleglycerol-phosphate dehydratase HisB [Defluviitaleaceae bacterium]
MRTASIVRTTNETDISASLNLDGTGIFKADMPIGFFEHMLSLMTRHGFFDLDLKVTGDTHIDAHHTVEDTGVVLGQALLKAVGDKAGIRRYGSAIVPMDDVLVLCAVDLSGRPYLHFEGDFTTPQLGEMDTELVKEFFQAISAHGKMNLHIKVLHGENNHHIAEGMFKAFGRALCEAVGLDARVQGVLSTKGSFD